MVFTNSLSSYYEKFLATGEVKCIDEEIPFEIPKGWEWSKLSNVIELLSGQDFIPEKYNSSNQGIPYITGASNIVNGNLAINRWTETPTVIGKLGDLLIVCKGSGVGKMCICNVDKIHIARQIQIIRNFSNAISLSYVKSVVEANLQTIISNAQGVIPGISREHILNLLIPLPPTNEQYEIDKKLQEILPFIDRYAKSQEALDKLNVELLGNLKKSILQEAVQGRLVQQIAEEGTGEELLEQIKLEKQQLIKEGKLKKSALTDSVIFRGDDNKYSAICKIVLFTHIYTYSPTFSLERRSNEQSTYLLFFKFFLVYFHDNKLFYDLQLLTSKSFTSILRTLAISLSVLRSG